MEQSISISFILPISLIILQSKSVIALTSSVEGETQGGTRLKCVRYFSPVISPQRWHFYMMATNCRHELKACYVQGTCMLLVHQHVPFYYKIPISFVREFNLTLSPVIGECRSAT